MEIWLQTGINMVILAAVYILMALGFAFILNLLGIFNLAHGAIFMVAAYICYLLVTSAGLSGWVALPVTIIIVAIMGVLVERILFRPFKGDFDLTTMICIFMSTVMVTSFNLRMGTKQIAIPSFIPGTTGVAPYLVQKDRIFVVAVSVAILVVVMLFVKYSKWGSQMQAITQNREGAALQGIRFSRIAATTCAVGFALAGIAGIFSGALYNLSPYMGDQNLVYVLMLVILSGVGSFRGIFIVGALMGIMYAGLPIVLPGVVVDATASVLVLILLLIRPQGFFGHEDADSAPASQATSDPRASGAGERPKWQSYGGVGVLIAVMAALPLFVTGGYWLHVLCMALIYVVVASSFRAITISGQFSIAHAAYFGVGAYISGMACMWLGWSPWLTIILGAIAATVVGCVLAFPFSRLRTMYYAMGTLFLGVVIVNLFTVGGKWTGGTSGLSGLQRLFSSSSRVPYYYLLLAVAIVSLVCLYRFEFSRIGVTLKAIAQSHRVASSVGISERWYRMLAVGFGCFFAGLAGGFYAHYQMAIAPTSFALSATLWIIMYVLVGGINSFWGPSIGVVVLLVLPEFFRDLKGYLPFVSAGILVIIAFTLRKQGLAGLPRVIKNLVTRRKKEVSPHVAGG